VTGWKSAKSARRSTLASRSPPPSWPLALMLLAFARYFVMAPWRLHEAAGGPHP
jgi:hypothetical protein